MSFVTFSKAKTRRRKPLMQSSPLTLPLPPPIPSIAVNVLGCPVLLSCFEFYKSFANLFICSSTALDFLF